MSGTPSALVVDNLSFAYGSKEVLRGIHIAPQPGQLVALLGANGAGKSTLFRCLAGLIRGQGRVTLGGQELASLPAAERLRRVCYIPQVYHTQARLTVYETVLMAQEQSGQRFSSRQAAYAQVERVLQLTELEDLAGAYLGELSGGQQQRAAAAQALSQNPEVLLMDEPTSALDLRYQLQTLELIRTFTQERGVTTLVALHDLNLAVRYADLLLLLRGGQIVMQGPPSELVQHPELGATYGVQLELARTASGIPLVAAHLPARGP